MVRDLKQKKKKSLYGARLLGHLVYVSPVLMIHLCCICWPTWSFFVHFAVLTLYN